MREVATTNVPLGVSDAQQAARLQCYSIWTQSEAFVQGHRQGSLMGVLNGPPQLKTYEAVIVETPEGRTVPAG